MKMNTNPALSIELQRRLPVTSHIYDFIFYLHPPVTAPPTKANPRDEAKAAACMAASPLRRRRWGDKTVRAGNWHLAWVWNYFKATIQLQYVCLSTRCMHKTCGVALTLLSSPKPLPQYQPTRPGCQACRADCGHRRYPGCPGWTPGWAAEEGKEASCSNQMNAF